jgi:TP901 family phage tail tape measure protein
MAGVSSAQQALTTAIAGTIGKAMEFQSTLAAIGASTNATKAQMAAMREEALRIGADTSKSASEAAAAMGELARSGISVEDVVGGVARTVVQLSEATGSSVSNMATLISDSLNVFKLGAGDAAGTADTLAKAANASSIDIDQMARSMSAGGLAAASAGLSVDEFATAVGLLGNAGLKASDAGTSLKAFISGLTPSSKEAKAAMDQLGFSAFDAAGKFLPFPQILQNLSAAFAGLTQEQRVTTAELLFGSDGIRAFTALMDAQTKSVMTGTTGWQDFQTQMSAANGVAEMSAARQETLAGKMDALSGSIETLGIKIGEQALPQLALLVDALNKLSQALDTKPVQAFLANFTSQWFAPLILGAAALEKVKDGVDHVRDSMRDATPAQEAAAASFVKFNGATNEISGALGEVSTAARGAGQALETAARPAQPFAAALAAVEKAAKDGKSSLEAMGKAIDDLAGQGTAAEQVWDRQGKSLDAIAKNAKAATTELNPAQVKDWTYAAREFADQTGMSADELKRLDGSLRLVEKGGPAAQQGLKQIDDLLKPHQERVSSMTAAYRSTAEAQAALAKEQLGLGGSMADLKQAVVDMTATFLASMRQLPPNIATISAEVRASIYQMLPPDLYQKALELGMGFSAGLAAGIRANGDGVAAAARDVAASASGAASQMLQTQSPSKVAMAIGRDWTEGLAIGISSGEREALAAVSRLTLHIEQLQDQLRYAEPFSAHAAAIEQQITIYEAWKGKIEGVLKVHELELQMIEANTSALDKFNQERAKATAAADLRRLVGAGAADAITAAGTAVATGDRGDIQAALRAWDTFVETLRTRGVADFAAIGEAGRDAIAEALAATTPEEAQAALAGLTTLTAPLETALREAATLSASTYNQAYAAAVADEATRQRVGEKGMALVRAVTEAVTNGSPQTIAALATAQVAYEAELTKLPTFIGGPLRAQVQAAMQAVAASPNDPEVVAERDAALAASNAALQVIPANFDALAPQVQASVLRMWEAVQAGSITGEEAARRVAGVTAIIGDDFDRLPSRVQASLATLASAVENGLLDTREAARRGEAVSEIIGKDFNRLPPIVRAALSTFANAVENGMMSAAEATERASEITRFALKALESEFPEVRRAAEAYIQSLVEGGPVNYEFADGLKTVEEQARLTARGLADAAAEAQRLAIAQRDANNAAANYRPPASGPRGTGGATAEGGGSEFRTTSGAPASGVEPGNPFGIDNSGLVESRSGWSLDMLPSALVNFGINEGWVHGGQWWLPGVGWQPGGSFTDVFNNEVAAGMVMMQGGMSALFDYQRRQAEHNQRLADMQLQMNDPTGQLWKLTMAARTLGRETDPTEETNRLLEEILTELRNQQQRNTSAAVPVSTGGGGGYTTGVIDGTILSTRGL